MSQRHEGAGLRTLVKLQSVRETLTGKTTEARYFLSSLPGDDAERIARLIRRHWAVENSLHWCLDMGFDEDHCRVGKDHGAEDLAVLRRVALNLLKQDKSCKLGIKNKRLKAVRNRDDLLKVMSQASATK